MASPDCAAGATELVGAVVADLIPSDWDGVYLGGFPSERTPNRAAAVSPAGGALPLSRVFGQARPEYVRGRVKVLLRDRNRDGSDNWAWLRQAANRIAARLDQVQANGHIAVAEWLHLTRDVRVPCDPHVGEGDEDAPRATYGPDIWMRVSQPPSFVQYGTPGTGTAGPRLNLIELAVEVTWRPERVRPLSAAIGPWSTDRLAADGTEYTVRSTEISAAGGAGRVWIGGGLTARAVSRLLPADDRVPPSVPGSAGFFPHGDAPISGPPAGRENDGMQWVNERISTTSSRGVLNIFSQTSGNLVTRTRGLGGGVVRIHGAFVLAGEPMRLRIEVSGYFDAAAERDFAFLLQDRGNPPARYVFRLRDAVRAVVSGDDTYTFPWSASKPPDAGDQWDWSLVDLTLFRLAAEQSRPPENPRFRLRWRPRWAAPVPQPDPPVAAEPLGEDVVVEQSGAQVVLPLVSGARPGGGNLEQVVSVVSADDPPLTRRQGYAVEVSGVEGCVVWGEYEPAAPDPQGGAPPAARHFHHAFSPDFG